MHASRCVAKKLQEESTPTSLHEVRTLFKASSATLLALDRSFAVELAMIEALDGHVDRACQAKIVASLPTERKGVSLEQANSNCAAVMEDKRVVTWCHLRV